MTSRLTFLKCERYYSASKAIFFSDTVPLKCISFKMILCKIVICRITMSKQHKKRRAWKKGRRMIYTKEKKILWYRLRMMFLWNARRRYFTQNLENIIFYVEKFASYQLRSNNKIYHKFCKISRSKLSLNACLHICMFCPRDSFTYGG